MGLFSNIFGRSKKDPAIAEAADVATIEQEEADRKKAENDALLASQKKERNALKKRGTTMQGGGREGLMFGQNQAGVA